MHVFKLFDGLSREEDDPLQSPSTTSIFGSSRRQKTPFTHESSE